MKLYLRTFKENETPLQLDQSQSWLRELVEGLDERLDELSPGKGQVKPPSEEKGRSISVQLKLQKLERVYMVKGKLHTSLMLICSRCAESFPFEVSRDFLNLFSQDRALTGSPEEDDVEDEIQYLTNDYIDLDACLQEQIQLEIPFQPLCQEGCQGLCSQCGKNRNQGPCQCKGETKLGGLLALKGVDLK